MHISCPSCGSIYDVPAIMLTSARAMRCATCGQAWQSDPIDLETARADMRRHAERAALAAREPDVLPPADVAPDMLSPMLPPLPASPSGDTAPATGSGATIAPDGMTNDDHIGLADRAPDAAAPNAAAPGLLPALAGWAISLAALSGATHAAIAHRDGIIAAWPASQRLYMWLGLG